MSGHDPDSSSPTRPGLGSVAAVVFFAAAALALIGTLAVVIADMDSGWWGPMGRHMGSSGGSSEASSEPVPGALAVDIRAGDLWFDPDTIEVAANEPVNVAMTNQGQVFHDLTIPDLAFAIDVAAGDTVTGALEVPAAGEYDFLCTVPGHANAGMRGTLIVRDQ